MHFELEGHDFARYDEKRQEWIVGDGEWEVLVAASASDVRLRQIITVEATRDHPAAFDQFTTIRELLQHPIGHEKVQPLVEEMKQGMSGASGDEAAERMMEGFLLDLPVIKLVTRGTLTRDELDKMLADVNR